MTSKKDINFKVPITKILNISPHPNPKVHSLQIAKVYDFDIVISSKSGYYEGMNIVYFPVNSILPGDLELFLFPPESKIKLEKSRIKAIKIHQFVSQGMIVPLDKINEFLSTKNIEYKFKNEYDLQDELNIVKYRPKYSKINNTEPQSNKPKSRTKNKDNEYFKEYKGCTNLKWVPNIFSEKDSVWISEKIHGSNARFGFIHKTNWKNLTFKQKIKRLFSFWEKYEFCYGSNHVQRQNKRNSPTYHGRDVFYQIIEKYDLENKLKKYPEYEIFGEIIGPSIQKGYHYGLKNDEIDIVIFDILHQTKKTSNWLSLKEAKDLTEKLGLKFVPVLYEGSWNKELALSLASGNSVFCEEQKCIEGVVVKNSNISSLDRQKIKIINPEYLMKESTGETSENDDFEDLET